MMLICGKSFIIAEDGAKTIAQCLECEQPELVIHPSLYAMLITSL